MEVSQCSMTSSMKAKFKATRTHPNCNQISTVSLGDRCRIKTSVHTITVKESPQKAINSTVNLNSRINHPIQTLTPSKFAPRKPSPIERIQPPNLSVLKEVKNRQSTSQVAPMHGILVTQERRQSSMSKPKEEKSSKQVVQPFEMISPVNKEKKTFQPRLSQDRFFVLVQKAQNPKRRSSSKMFPITPELIQQVISPAKNSPQQVIHLPVSVQRQIIPSQTLIHRPVQRQIVATPTSRQVELERKIKVLEIRVGELHLQKSAVETRMNELNIRLQYENNFLKEKLNSFPSLTQIEPMKNTQNKHIKSMSIRESIRQPIRELPIPQKSQEVPPKSQNTLFFTCPISQRTFEKISSSNSSRQNGLNKLQMVNTQDHFFTQNNQEKRASIEFREAILLKQQLSEAEEMLANEIGKNFKLLEDLTAEQKSKELLKEEISRLEASLESKTKEIETLNKLMGEEKTTYKSLNQQHVHIPTLVLNRVSSQTTRITKEFQDKIFNLEMQINWLNEKLQEAEKRSSEIKLPSVKYSAGTNVEVMDKFNLAMNVQLTNQNIQLEEKIQELEVKIGELQKTNQELRQRNEEQQQMNEQLRRKYEELSKRVQSVSISPSYSSSQYVPIQHINQLKQNNQIFMFTIKSLEQSLYLTQQSLEDVSRSKYLLEQKVTHLQTQLRTKQTQYEKEIQIINMKLHEINDLVEQKSTQIQHFHDRIQQKDHLLHQREQLISILQEEVQTLTTHRNASQKDEDQKASSTQTSYYQKSSEPQNYTKFHQLRKNSIDFNSFTNQNPAYSYVTFRPS